MAPKSDHKWHVTYMFGQSLHSFRVTTFEIKYCGSTQESLYPWSSAPEVVIHRFWLFDLSGVLLALPSHKSCNVALVDTLTN